MTFCFHLGLLAGVIHYFNIESVMDCEVLDTSAIFSCVAKCKGFFFSAFIYVLVF